jgi:hypothetical protein
MVLGTILVVGTAIAGFAWLKVRHNRKAQANQ